MDCAAYKVVFNPDRADLGIGPESLWRRHVATSPPATVYRRTWKYSKSPQRAGGPFVVPAVGEGRYLVAIYDGSEGGAHYTWDDFRVTADAPAARSPSPEPPPAGARGAGSGAAVTTAAGVGFAALALGTALGWQLARRRS